MDISDILNQAISDLIQSAKAEKSACALVGSHP